MNAAVLVIVLGVGLGTIAVVLNHVYARLALVELALNEGLPPGHERSAGQPVASVTANPQGVVGPGIHVFLSRTCHACQRLIDELEQIDLDVAAELHLRYVDRPRPIAASAAARQAASLHDHQLEVATQLGADPLPYTVAVGPHDLVSRAVTPTVDQVLAAARDAGISAERRARV